MSFRGARTTMIASSKPSNKTSQITSTGEGMVGNTLLTGVSGNRRDESQSLRERPSEQINAAGMMTFSQRSFLSGSGQGLLKTSIHRRATAGFSGGLTG